MAITDLYSNDFETGDLTGLSYYTGGVSVSSTAPRHGTYCGAVSITAGAGGYGYAKGSLSSSTANAVARFGIKVNPLPGSGTQEVAALASSSLAKYAVLTVSSTGQLSLSFTGGTPVTGPTIDTAWHLIELQVDVSGSAWTADWKVDGTLQTRATATWSSNTIACAVFGTPFDYATDTYTVDVDDVKVGSWTNASTDWYGDVGGGGTTFTQALSASLSPSGALSTSHVYAKALSGSVGLSGALGTSLVAGTTHTQALSGSLGLSATLSTTLVTGEPGDFMDFVTVTPQKPTAIRYLLTTLDPQSDAQPISYPTAELPFSGVTFSLGFNTAGPFSATLNLEDRQVQSSNWINATNPGKCFWWVEIGGQLVYGGRILHRTYNLATQSVTITGADFHSYWSQRLQAYDYTAKIQDYVGATSVSYAWAAKTAAISTPGAPAPMIAWKLLRDAAAVSGSLPNLTVPFHGQGGGSKSDPDYWVSNPDGYSTNYVTVSAPLSQQQSIDSLLQQFVGMGHLIGVDIVTPVARDSNGNPHAQTWVCWATMG